MAEMNPRTRRRIDQIKEKIPIAQVLFDYGYPVRPDGEDREEQFPCDLHGDGHDNKPSARMYPESASFYCFACGVSRDAIELVKIKENISFIEAVQILETRYKLPAVPWDSADYKSSPKPEQEILSRLKYPERTLKDDIRVLRSILSGETKDRSIPMHVILPFWEGSDQIEYLVEKGKLSEVRGRAAIQSFTERLHGKIKEIYNAKTPE